MRQSNNGSAAPTTKIEWLSVNKLEANKFQPREFFDEAALAELALSIKTHGVLQPILVRTGTKKPFQIVYGERRWRASQLAEEKLIPCIVKDLDDLQAAQLALEENIQDESLTDYEEAAGIKNLWKAYEQAGEEMSERKMARRLNKSVTYIRNRTGLFKMHPDVIEMTKRHRNVLSVADAIDKVTDKSRRLEYEQMVDEGASFRDVVSAIATDNEREAHRRESQTPDKFSRQSLTKSQQRERAADKHLEQELTRVAHTLTSLPAWVAEASPKYRAKALREKLQDVRQALSRVEKSL